MPTKANWPREIHRVFRESDIRQVCYVPDAGHARLVELCHADKSLHTVSLTTEEEGVAMLADLLVAQHQSPRHGAGRIRSRPVEDAGGRETSGRGQHDA